jgi:opacity protein-like surface antigen
LPLVRYSVVELITQYIKHLPPGFPLSNEIVMDITKNKPLLACLIGALLSFPTVAFAGADSGIYLGAGVGEINVEVSTFDESDTAYKIFGGYNFGFIPLLDLAIEASYIDFGNPGSGPVDIELAGASLFGLAGFKLGPVGLFAKVGAINWDSKISIDLTDEDDSGTDPAYGVGARLQFGSFAIRAEYEYFDVSDVKDASMISASAIYTF